MALGLDLAHTAFDLFDVGPHDQLVAGDDGMAEAEFVDAREERDEAAVFFRIEQATPPT